MKQVLEAAAELSRFFESRGWQFCIIGGLAVVRWGRARVTADVDATLLTGFGAEAGFVSELLQAYSPRRDDASEFALATRILLLQSASGVGIDVALAGFPFEQRAVDRGSQYSYTPEVTLQTCSAEDLIVLKAFAGRPRDWGDIEGVILCQGETLDWELIVQELTHLCELIETRDPLDHLIQLRDELSAE